MPQPRNLTDDLCEAIIEFAAETAFCQYCDINDPGRRSANGVLGRWIAVAIIVELYGASLKCASEVAGIGQPRVYETRTLWSEQIPGNAKDQIFARWEKYRRANKLPTPMQIQREWSAEMVPA